MALRIRKKRKGSRLEGARPLRKQATYGASFIPPVGRQIALVTHAKGIALRPLAVRIGVGQVQPSGRLGARTTW